MFWAAESDRARREKRGGESLIVVTEERLTRRHEATKDSRTAIPSALCASAALCEAFFGHPSSFITRQFLPTDRPEPVELSRETNGLPRSARNDMFAVSYEYPTSAPLASSSAVRIGQTGAPSITQSKM